MTNRFEQDVQGFAMYVELRRPQITTQCLFVPAGFSESLGVIPPIFFRRSVDVYHKRKNWNGTTIANDHDILNAISAGVEPLEETLDQHTLRFSKTIKSYLASAVAQKYKIFNAPIYVEVTKADLEAARSMTMPAKLWTRVKSARTAAGYPEQATFNTEEWQAKVDAATSVPTITTPAF